MQDPTDSNEQPVDPAAAKKKRQKPIGVPRRFAVGTGLIIMTMYSVLFGVMKSLGAPPPLFAAVAVFLTVVGAAQMFLFGGRRPRDASFVAGALLLPLIVLTAFFVEWQSGGLGPDPLSYLPAVLLFYCVLGVLLGYLAGCLTAGVFLILGRIDEARHGARAESEEILGVGDADTRRRPSWDERWYNRIRKVLSAVRPYHRGRPIGDAASLVLILLVLAGPTVSFPFWEWPWWVHLLGTLAAGLLLGTSYAGVRLCGWKNSLWFGLLGGAGALGPNELLQRLFFFPDRPLSEHVPPWLVVVLGVVLGFIVLAIVAMLRRVCVPKRPPCVRAPLGLVAVTAVLLAAIYAGAWLTLLRISQRPRQQALASIHRLGGAVGAGWNSPVWAVDYIDLPGGTTDADIQYLAGLKEVIHLDLSYTRITDAGLAHLKDLSQLESVYLFETRITGSGLRHLRGNKSLTFLILNDSPVTDEGLASLKHLTGLKSLYLKDTNVSDAVLSHLRGHPYLRTLILHGTHVTGSGLEGWGDNRQRPAGTSPPDPRQAAMAALQQRAGLQRLGLANTPVTDAALVHIGKIVSLQGLTLAETEISDAGLVHLNGLANLTCLDLSGTRITGAGLKQLAALTQLSELTLADTHVTDADLVHLKRMGALTLLDLSRTQITDAGLKHLNGLTNLENLEHEGTQVTEEAVRALLEPTPDDELAP